LVPKISFNKLGEILQPQPAPWLNSVSFTEDEIELVFIFI
jgi:hypothetical protein